MVELYPDWKSGTITREEYMRIQSDLNEKVTALDGMISNIRKNMEQMEEGVDGENEFISHFKKYGNFDKLTRPMLVELVDKIRVFEGNRIEIDLKFTDAYQQVIEYIELNQDTAKAQ